MFLSKQEVIHLINLIFFYLYEASAIDDTFLFLKTLSNYTGTLNISTTVLHLSKTTLYIVVEERIPKKINLSALGVCIII